MLELKLTFIIIKHNVCIFNGFLKIYFLINMQILIIVV